MVLNVVDFAGANAGVFSPSAFNTTGLEILQLSTISRIGAVRLNGTYMNGTSDLLWNDSTQTLSTLIGGSSGFSGWIDGVFEFNRVQVMQFLNFNGVYSLGQYSSNTYDMNGLVQEFIIYPTEETVNRVGIETNINDNYTIY